MGSIRLMRPCARPSKAEYEANAITSAGRREGRGRRASARRYNAMAMKHPPRPQTPATTEARRISSLWSLHRPPRPAERRSTDVGHVAGEWGRRHGRHDSWTCSARVNRFGGSGAVAARAARRGPDLPMQFEITLLGRTRDEARVPGCPGQEAVQKPARGTGRSPAPSRCVAGAATPGGGRLFLFAQACPNCGARVSIASVQGMPGRGEIEDGACCFGGCDG